MTRIFDKHFYLGFELLVLRCRTLQFRQEHLDLFMFFDTLLNNIRKFRVTFLKQHRIKDSFLDMSMRIELALYSFEKWWISGWRGCFYFFEQGINDIMVFLQQIDRVHN